MFTNPVQTNIGINISHNNTVCAAYSQGDVGIFGENAGQQCVVMSLCALIYHQMKGITNPDDLKQIMHIGNQLYGSLSRLVGQSFLLLTELPPMLTVLEENYQLEYSESYTGDVYGESTIEGYQYYMGMKRAFESLLTEQYSSFILTVSCISVAIIYCANDGHFKVFDSHARDIYGRSHPQGTCVLLDIPSIDNLVQYFQGLYGTTDLYELKGLNITKYDIATSNSVRDIISTTDQHKCFKKQSFAIGLYSICYSIILPCSYWNSNTLDAIIKKGSQLYDTIDNENHSTAVELESVNIFGTNINVNINAMSRRELHSSTESRISLETLILRNHDEKNRIFVMLYYLHFFFSF